MGTVVVNLTVSLDPTTVPTFLSVVAECSFSRKVVVDEWMTETGAMISGRRTFGTSVRLFDQLGPDPIALEQMRVIESKGVTHLRYRVVRHH